MDWTSSKSGETSQTTARHDGRKAAFPVQMPLRHRLKLAVRVLGRFLPEHTTAVSMLDRSAKDNDLEGSGPRTNIWGERIAATVSGPSGDYSYTVVFTNQSRDFQYLKGSASFALKPR